MSATPDPSLEKRRSFLVLVGVLIAGVAIVAYVLGRGGDGAGAVTPTPSASGSAVTGAVSLHTACAEIAPDMALRVDALRRTADLVRADIATMQGAGNTTDAVQAAKVADALEAVAVAVDSQKGVRQATREMGQTLASIC
ncbi:MAG: hypothetical protein ABI869_06000 [Actinomycetota bacterium]